jgi:hypothetical protein
MRIIPTSPRMNEESRDETAAKGQRPLIVAVCTCTVTGVSLGEVSTTLMHAPQGNILGQIVSLQGQITGRVPARKGIVPNNSKAILRSCKSAQALACACVTVYHRRFMSIKFCLPGRSLRSRASSRTTTTLDSSRGFILTSW